MGQQDGSAVKSACEEDWKHEFNPQKQRGRRKETSLTSCPLMSTRVVTNMCPHAYTYTQHAHTCMHKVNNFLNIV